MTYTVEDSPMATPLTGDEQLLDKLEVVTLQGLDKGGRPILRIVGKFYPAKVLKGKAGEEALKGYLEKRIFPKLEMKPFVIIYVHSCVNRNENFPGLSLLRHVFDAVPETVIDRLRAVYFLHPGLQSRLFFATIGRFVFNQWLFGKLRYISRVEFLKAYVAKGGIEIPDFAKEHDGKLEKHPFLDYGFVTANSIEWDDLDYRKCNIEDFSDDLRDDIPIRVPRVSTAF